VLGHEQACRPIWSEDLDSFGASYLHTVDEAIAEKFRWLRAYPEQFSRERDAYGLIHADFHRGNFYVHNGTLTLFDFDDSQYSWFAEDIAMALFYAISPRSWSPEERAIAQAFYDAFMEGYNRENSLDVHWLHEVPYFLKQREMNLFVILTALGEYEQGPWTRQFMEQRRQRILDDAPFVDIKFW
jgi:Ser/Thr protein kinase RdoA (MazF antagonist)